MKVLVGFFILNSMESTKRFISKSIEKHGDKYDYSLVDYVKAKSKVIIICKLHGEFLQTPDSHARGSGCNNCKGNRISLSKTSNRESFIKKANVVHNNKYDYSKLLYKNSRSKGTITCPIHGDFEQELNSHMRGSGCRECQKVTLSELKSKGGYSWKHGDWETASKKSKFFKSFFVYIIMCWDKNECFYKIGKTFRGVSKRFDSKKAMPYNWEVVELFKFDDSKKASNLEIELHKANKLNKYKPTKDFCGSNECYNNIN